jgi:hypothetical protein
LLCENTIEHRHPFTGERQVLRVLQEREDFVSAGTPLFEIGDPSALKSWRGDRNDVNRARRCFAPVIAQQNSAVVET